MIKVTYIISNTDQASFFENTFRLIDRDKFNISVIFLNPGKSPLEEFIISQDILYERINYRGKKDYIRALYRIYKFLRKQKPDIVHAHLIDAGVLGLFAAFLARIKRRIYTRHGGSQKIFLKKGVKHDKVTDRLSTHIIATCENVKQILIEEEHVPPSKISVINLAFEIDRFSHPDFNRLKELKSKYNPYNRQPVVGVISRWVEWKGIQYIIPAFRKFLSAHPNALLILANARGSYAPELQKELQLFKPGEVTLIAFEKNFHELYQLFDFFVHVPIGKQYEAFGQIYIEALSAGIPSIFTMAGIAPEIITDNYNAVVVDFKNSEQIVEALNGLCSDPVRRERLIQNGKATVQGKFGFTKYIEEQGKLYEKALNLR